MIFESGLAPLLQRFAEYRKATGRVGSRSNDSLRSFDRFCKTEYPHATELTQEMVDTWCQKRPIEKNSSCAVRCTPIRNFVVYLRNRNLTTVEPPMLPKAGPVTFIPHAFTKEEIRRFFEVCDNLPHSGRPVVCIRGITVPVFFRLLYSSGIRTTEARLLKSKDVDLTHGILSIHDSKGPDQHYVVLHDSMADLMRRYDMAIRRWHPKRVYFFPSKGDVPYTAQWVVWNFRQIWSKVSPDNHATAYAFRHHYATTNINQWIDKGFDFDDKLTYLSKSMGHKTVNSTVYYYSIVPGLSQLLLDKTEKGFNEIVPEVEHEQK